MASHSLPLYPTHGDSVIYRFTSPPLALRDRLGAMLEAVIIGDRWATHRHGTPDSADPSWPGAFLEAIHACIQDYGLVHPAWQPRLRSLGAPAAVAIVAFPHLWLQADAYRHHQASVDRWVSNLGVSAAATQTCHGLFEVLTQAMGEAVAGPGTTLRGGGGDDSPEHWGDVLGSAVALVAQSQGQLTTALRIAHQRHSPPSTIALVGLLVGLAGGRASLGASLRQRWLVDPCPVGVDPWQGLQADTLERLTADLYARWAGAKEQSSAPQSRLG